MVEFTTLWHCSTWAFRMGLFVTIKMALSSFILATFSCRHHFVRSFFELWNDHLESIFIFLQDWKDYWTYLLFWSCRYLTKLEIQTWWKIWFASLGLNKVFLITRFHDWIVIKELFAFENFDRNNRNQSLCACSKLCESLSKLVPSFVSHPCNIECLMIMARLKVNDWTKIDGQYHVDYELP
jgi:hypothetical protein